MSTETFWKSPDARHAFDLARQITARHARSFYFSAQLLPSAQRWGTYGLYGFCRHADNLVDEAGGLSDDEICADVAALETALRSAYDTGASDVPVVDAFIRVANRFAIPCEYPLALLEGVRMDIGGCRYATREALDTYCYRVAGVVGLMMTHVLGYGDDAAFAHAERLGIAMQLTNILRDVDEDRRTDRIYLPGEDLAAFSVSEGDILAGRISPALRDLVRALVDRAHAGYDAAEPGIDMLAPRSRFAIRAASRIYRGILHRIEARDYDPFLGRVHVSGQRKAGIVIVEALRSGLPPIGRRFGLSTGSP